MERKTAKVLGYSVDLLTFDNASDNIFENITKGRGMQIVTLNPEMIETAQKNKDFENILNASELVIPESSGIKLALKLKGISQEQIPGIEIARNLLTKCAQNSTPVALIGAKENVISQTVENLKNENINVVYFRNGYFNDDEQNDIINQLAQSNPAFVLVALGSPKQEFFIKECRKKMNKTVFIGVGGAFDVWSGNVKRAPFIFRKYGCEWLYRVITQPDRIKRIYKTLPSFLFKVIIDSKCKKENK